MLIHRKYIYKTSDLVSYLFYLHKQKIIRKFEFFNRLKYIHKIKSSLKKFNYIISYQEKAN